ncbi:kinase-like domain-containing protein [Mycena sanguinolenta]|nr:kinase-like domain-containing protein [Mycena sanguinolenta]
MTTRILIYEALISYLKDACNAGIPGSGIHCRQFDFVLLWSRRSPSEVAQLHATLDEYLLSMASDNIVSGIGESVECLKTLLELSADLGLRSDSKLRMALHRDREKIAALLVFIFKSKPLEEAVLRLEGASAQYFLDVVQNTLDTGFLLAQEDSRMARRIIRKLVRRSDKLPSALFISGITGKEEHPTFGGGFADIYRASYSNRVVALKYMRVVQYMRGSDLRALRLKFCREALVWKELCHPYILPFLGIEENSFPSRLCMVSPWMEHGTVLNYLKQHGHRDVDRLLYEIAQGLQYLHSRNIVHGDLRGANILINEDWSACLTDFGLSIFSDATSLMTTNRGGSAYWMAPELLDPDRFGMRFARTPASDVYAFGCVCLELYTGRPPFSGVLSEPGAMMKILNGERPPRPSNSPAMSDVLWSYVSMYWAQEPTTRPATQLVVQNMFLLLSSAPIKIPDLSSTSAGRPPSLTPSQIGASSADQPAPDRGRDHGRGRSVLFNNHLRRSTSSRERNVSASAWDNPSSAEDERREAQEPPRRRRATRVSPPIESIQLFQPETPACLGARFSRSLTRRSPTLDDQDWATNYESVTNDDDTGGSIQPETPAGAAASRSLTLDDPDWETDYDSVTDDDDTGGSIQPETPAGADGGAAASRKSVESMVLHLFKRKCPLSRPLLLESAMRDQHGIGVANYSNPAMYNPVRGASPFEGSSHSSFSVPPPPPHPRIIALPEQAFAAAPPIYSNPAMHNPMRGASPFEGSSHISHLDIYNTLPIWTSGISRLTEPAPTIASSFNETYRWQDFGTNT